MNDDDDMNEYQRVGGYFDKAADRYWHNSLATTQLWHSHANCSGWAFGARGYGGYSSLREELIAPIWSDYGETTDYVDTHSGCTVRGRSEKSFRLDRQDEMKPISPLWNKWYAKVSGYRILLYDEE